jgi:hypothetical protein
MCKTKDEAQTAIDADGFALGTVSTDPGGATPASNWVVSVQSPTPGTKVPAGTKINITLKDPTTFTCTP